MSGAPPAGGSPSVAGVVLAAGLARRFGGGKLAAPLDGRPLVGHVLDTVRSAVKRRLLATALVVVASGPDAPPDATVVRRLAEERGLAVVDNDDPAAGLARSLRLGLEALATTPAGAALVVLGDQPRSGLEVIAALVERWRTAPAVAILVPRYRGEGRGNPVVLARKVWPLAARLRGDRGMSAIMGRVPDLVVYLEVDGVNPDVDRPADLEALSGPPR